MKVLIISAGKNKNNITENSYIDFLPSSLSKSGAQVAWLQMACINYKRPFLHFRKEMSDSVSIYKIFNSMVYAGLPPGCGQGTKTPSRDFKPSKGLVKIFETILNDFLPDIVHIQNFFGFPTNLIYSIKSKSIPAITTLHDYTPICPTSHLFLNTLKKPCDLDVNNLKCASCCERSPTYARFTWNNISNAILSGINSGSIIWKNLAGIRNIGSRFIASRESKVSNFAYVERLENMTRALKICDVVHCISYIQARSLERSTGPLSNIIVKPIVPPTIRHINPVERQNADSSILTFVVLNVNAGRDDKGYSLLLNVLKEIENERLNFDVRWYAEGHNSKCISFLGKYQANDLDQIAAQADYCIIPSVWYETLAFTGLEMLSRGVPLLCSNRAGVSEFVTPETGILFNPEYTDMIKLFKNLLLNASESKKLRNCVALDNCKIATYQSHIAEILDLYKSRLQGIFVGEIENLAKRS